MNLNELLNYLNFESISSLLQKGLLHPDIKVFRDLLKKMVVIDRKMVQQNQLDFDKVKAKKEQEEPEQLWTVYNNIFIHLLLELRFRMEDKIDHKAANTKSKLDLLLIKILDDYPEPVFWIGITQAYQESGLVFSEEFKQKFHIHLYQSGLMTEAQEKTFHTAEQLVEEFVNAIVEQNLSELEVSELLSSQFTLMPKDAVQVMIHGLLASDLLLAQNYGIYMLLHPEPDIRNKAVDALVKLSGSAQYKISPHNMNRLLLLRDWLPEAEKKKLEKAIRNLRMHHAQFAEKKVVEIEQALATIFDGFGCQSLVIFHRDQKQLNLSSIAIKINAGIQATFINDHIKKRELKLIEKQLFQEEKPCYVSLEYLDKLVSHFIYQMNLNNQVPPFSMLEIYERVGDRVWRAEEIDLESELKQYFAHIHFDLNHIPNQEWENTANLIFKNSFDASWFECDETALKLLQQINKKFVDEKSVIVEILLSIFEPAREKWQWIFFFMGLREYYALDGKNELAFAFMLNAWGVQQGRSLLELPLMSFLAENTRIQI